MTIYGYQLVETCSACPEQYDVFYKNTPQGYLRLRHGVFTAQYPCPGGKIVYEADTKGDGCFHEDERMEHLTRAVIRIDQERERAAGTMGRRD